MTLKWAHAIEGPRSFRLISSLCICVEEPPRAYSNPKTHTQEPNDMLLQQDGATPLLRIWVPLLLVCRFNSRGNHWNFSMTSSFRPHYGPRVDSASNRYEYQGYLLEGKAGRLIGLKTLTSSCADYLEILGASTSWNRKDRSGPVLR